MFNVIVAPPINAATSALLAASGNDSNKDFDIFDFYIFRELPDVNYLLCYSILSVLLVVAYIIKHKKGN